jgi:hypothetical protein
MEIKEIVSYFLNEDTDILDVSFRTIEDPDDVVRVDKIDFTIIEEYGFELITDTFDLFNDEDNEDDSYESEKIELDEDELIMFLNEYYMINPDELPKAELF